MKRGGGGVLWELLEERGQETGDVTPLRASQGGCPSKIGGSKVDASVQEVPPKRGRGTRQTPKRQAGSAAKKALAAQA